MRRRPIDRRAVSRRFASPALRPVLGAIAVLLLSAAARPAGAQVAPRRSAAGGPTVEGRVEMLAARSTTVQLGAAALWPVSPYLRVGALAAAGVTRGPDAAGGRAASARAEVVARFTLNPDPAARWRLYGQATGGVLAIRGNQGRALVSASIGAEHAAVGPVRPAIELGIGGGLRVAIALRRSR